MCGLAGCVAWDQRLAADAAVLQRMSASIAHRGPDDRGDWTQQAAPGKAAVSLTHCRLAVLDLDARSRQPMADPSGTLHLVFNGEIYNYRELRAELAHILSDFAWRTTSDTEVILAAWRVWGEKCPEHFSGMFAFALWDDSRQTLFLARDRMGQKPLYLATSGQQPGAVGFASELPALLALPWVSREVNVAAVGDYLAWGYIPSPATIYRDVQSLPPGHCMLLSASGQRSWRYYDPNAPVKVAGSEDPASLTRQLVQQAVQRQLVSDVPIGCLLSGGIDSSCIAAAMRSMLPREQVRTFTVSFADPRYDEAAYAQRMAAHLGTHHQTFRAEPHIAEDLPRICAVMGQPFADSSILPTHYLSRYTRKEVTVALGGDGGDELFCGYDRYRAMDAAERLPSLLRHVLALPLWQTLPGTHPKSLCTRLKRFAAATALAAPQRYAAYMRLFPAAQVEDLLRPELRETAGKADYLETLFASLQGARSVSQAAMATDRVSYLPEDLLTKVDRASMLHALEVRSPFMDHDLVSFAAGLPDSHLLRGGKKPLLRQAFAKDLPAEVFARPKMGFAVPLGAWLRGELRPMLGDLLSGASFASQHFRPEAVARLRNEHDSNARDHSQRLYALLVLELWWREQR